MEYTSNNPTGETTQVATTELVGKRLMDNMLGANSKPAVKPSRRWLPVRNVPLAIAIGLMAVIFVCDLFLKVPVAVQLFYIVPILVSLWAPPQQHTLHIANASTVLTVLGAF